MEKYRRVVNHSGQNDGPPDPSHVVRINVSGKLTNYISYAQKKLFDDSTDGGKVELVALGRSINRA
eukprot:IDg9574t1